MSDSEEETSEAAAPSITSRNPEWIVEIQMALGCVDNDTVRTGSICRIPDKIIEAEAKYKKGHKSSYNYKPEVVAMGPFHRGTRSDLQIMEQTKWRYTRHILKSSTEETAELKTVEKFSEGMKNLICIFRASYSERIELEPEELSRMMLLDTCFLLEFLVRLCLRDHSDDPLLGDEKKILRVLTDLTLLENQIPFVLLQTLSVQIISLTPPFELQQQLLDHFLVNGETFSPKKLAELLFNIVISDDYFSEGVYHFLHLIHLCSPDPYKKRDIYTPDQVKLEHCARKLQALGITIKVPSDPTDSQDTVAVNGERGQVDPAVSAKTKFMDKFQFKIDFDEDKEELTIPTLHIKEATEVKWRNYIALEQLGLTGIGYKFTSYAHFFKGLVSSVHDIQLLKKNNVIKVHTNVKDEDLVTMFQSITIGVEHIDGRYEKENKRLKKVIKMKKRDVVGYCTCVLPFRLAWHYLWRAWEWLRYRSLSFLQRIIDTYVGIPGNIIAFFVGAAILALTITQTIYAVRAKQH